MEYTGPERRSDKPGRRGRDYETCVFHVEHTAKLKELESGTVPKWVFTWVGGGMAGLLLSLSAWTAYQVTIINKEVAVQGIMIEEIKHRQDFLRSAHVELLQKFDKK